MPHSADTVSVYRRTQRRSLLITMLIYWILVMGIWGVFAFDRGLPFETSFPVACQNNLHDCLNYADELRPYNSLFLGLGYLLGFDNGSYVTYQLLYGFLWWGRGVLIYLIFRRLFPESSLFSFLVGALVIVHASDGALNWIGQLHQFGFIFLFILAVYLLLESWLAQRASHAITFLVLSLPALYVSLWTYESHFFLVISIPILLFVLRPKLNLRFIATMAIWYIIPTVYGWLQFQKYLIAKVNNYQTSIARADLSLNTILTDIQAHIWQSLQFWKWSNTLSIYSIGKLAPVVALICVFAFVIGAYLLSPNSGFLGLQLPPTQSLWTCLSLGFLFLILSLPIYLLIAGNTMFWRTQMLPSVGAAICLGSGICLLAKILPKKKYQPLFVIIACTVIVFSGVRSGVALQGFHEYRWQIHRAVMAQVAHLVPSIKDNTMILLTNMPKAYEKDPFGAAMWFDFPIQLLYPRRTVVGYFIYENGDSVTDNPWSFTATGMEWQRKGMPQKLDKVMYSQIIALQYNSDSQISLLEQFPRELLPQAFDLTGYNPLQRIKQEFIPDRSIRMFAR
ncbi:hypothetical protein ACN4EK_16050 [Pantanalinema rosaneae CENA516]|uniref:hypothetical protein n=1 Tax=Pantanalinema rosaneae TaxID=1620701 RepID=UPI003D6EBCF5